MLRACPAYFPSFGHRNNLNKTNVENVYYALLSSLAAKLQSRVFKYRLFVRSCVRACYSNRSQLQLTGEYSTGRRVGLGQEHETNVQGWGGGGGGGVGPAFLSKGRMCRCRQEKYISI
jgi:hypothetical protein